MNNPIPLPDVDEAVIAYGHAREDYGDEKSPANWRAAREAYTEVKKEQRKWEEAMRADDQATIQMQAAVIAELRAEISRLKTGAVA